MKLRVVLLMTLLILVSGCYAGTEPVLRKDLALVADNFEGLGKETRLRISDAAQVFRLTKLDAPEGFKLLDVETEDWSFYLVRFNLQTMPLNREEVKSTYFAVKFDVKYPSSSSTRKVTINELFPASTSRQIYLFESDLKAGGQARMTAEAGYGWLRKEKKEDREKETKKETQKGTLSEKVTVTEAERTAVTEEGFDQEGKKITNVKTTKAEKSKVSETEKYETEAVDKSFLRSLEKITDVDLNFTAAGKAYLEASAAFSMSYKREKREPLITATGRLSDTAVWLDRQPFQNGDKYFSVIIKVPRPSKEMANYFVQEYRKSKSEDLNRLLKLQELQVNRHKVVLRFADDKYLEGVFDEQAAALIKLIRGEIKELEKEVKKSREKLGDKSSNEQIGGYLHDHLKLLYKYESFTETYEETLRQKLLQKGKKALSDGQKFAVSYQVKQITRHRKDIQLFLAKNEIAVYQISCKAEVQINVDGVLLPPMKTDISFSEPERVISLVLK